MKTFFKVIGKLLAALLGVVLFITEIVYAISGPMIDLAADILSQPEEVLKQIDITEVLENSDFASSYKDIVSTLSTNLNITFDEAKELVNSEPVKEALGKVMKSVVQVTLGDETAKLSTKEITDIIVEAGEKLVKQKDNFYLPDNFDAIVEQEIENIGIDALYEKLKGLVGSTSYFIEDVHVLSTNKELDLNDVIHNISNVEILRVLATRKINIAILCSIIVIVALMMLCHFSIVQGLLEAGYITMMSSIPPFALYIFRNKIYAIANCFDLPFDISNFELLEKYLNTGIYFLTIGIICIVVAVILKKVFNKKKAIKIENKAEIQPEVSQDSDNQQEIVENETNDTQNL